MNYRLVAITLLSVILQADCCFIVHFVFYGQDVCCFILDRLMEFKHPFVLHLNEEIMLPDSKKIERSLTDVQKAYMKSIEVLHTYGGLYLDNDQLIDIQCVKNQICKPHQTSELSNVYLIDQSQMLNNKNKNGSIRTSFIYAPAPNNPVLKKIMMSYNQSQKDASKFSGPAHIQKFKQHFKYIRIKRQCQKHINARSYQFVQSTQMTAQNYMITANWNDIYHFNKTEKQKKQFELIKQFFMRLVKTNSIIYPSNYHFEQNSFQNSQYNHVQMIDLKFFLIKVKHFSKDEIHSQNLMKLIKQFQAISIKKLKEQQKQNKVEKIKTFQKQRMQKGLNQISQINQKIQNLKQIKKQYQKQIFEFFYLRKYDIMVNQDKKSRGFQFIDICIDLLIILGIIRVLMYIIRTKQRNQNGIIVQQNQFFLTFKNQFKKQQFQQKQIQKSNRYIEKFIIFLVTFLFILNIKLRSQSISSNKQIIDQPQIFSDEAKKQYPYQQFQFYFQFQSQIQPANISDQTKKKYGIPLNPFQNKLSFEIYLTQLGIIKQVQIGSQYDYLNILKRKQFYDFSSKFIDQVQFQLFQFQYDYKLEKQRDLINYTEFEDHRHMDYELQNIQRWFGRPKLSKNNTIIFLASGLVYNYSSSYIKQLQYYYYNKEFNLENIKNQLPMCIVSTGYQVYSKNKYKYFFESLQRQNYSNYLVVVIDDNSPDQSAKNFYEFLGRTNYSLKNRVKIVSNKEKIGALGNMYIYVRKFCPGDSIILNIDTDDGLIGYQTLNVLNAVYQDPNIWYAYTQYLMQLSPQTPPLLGQYSLALTINESQYRTHKSWNTSHMRTYRQKVMDRVPVEQYLEYYYDQESKLLLPRFYLYCADRFQVYSHIELCGSDRVRFLEYPLYFYDQSGTVKPCHYQTVHHEQFKSRTKNRLKRLQFIDSDLEYLPTEKFSPQLLQKYFQSSDLLQKCQLIHKMKYNLS